MQRDEDWRTLRAHIHQGTRILVITGAGMSADSGLPTYRGVSGLYNQGITEDNIPIEQALSGPMFRHKPEVTWKYIHQLEQSCRGAEPHEGHRSLAQWEAQGIHVCLLTQNVDGLHEKAGSKRVIPIHGELSSLRCTNCGDTQQVADYKALPPLPLCPLCGGIVRPNVVLFGEALPEDAVSHFYREMALGFDVVMSIGTTSVFPYIAEPMRQALQWNALTVEVNPDVTEVSPYAKLRFRIGAAEFFRKLSKES